AAQKLAVPNDDRVQPRCRDAERLEEAGHLVEAVNLPPPGRQKQKPDAEPPQEHRDAALPFEHTERFFAQPQEPLIGRIRHSLSFILSLPPLIRRASRSVSLARASAFCHAAVVVVAAACTPSRATAPAPAPVTPRAGDAPQPGVVWDYVVH